MSNKPNGDKTAFSIDPQVSCTDVFTVGDVDQNEDLITLAATEKGISASGSAEAIIKLSQALLDKNITHDVIQLPGFADDGGFAAVGVLTAETPLPSIMYKKIAGMLRPV